MTNRQIDTQAKTQAQPPGLLRWCATLERTAFVMLLTALLWAPWPLGSNRPWALALLGAMLWVGLALAALGRVLQPPQPRHNRAAGWWLPVAAMAAFAALLVLQLLPGLGVEGGTLSIAPFQTRAYLFATLTYAAAWGLTLLTVTTAERATLLLGAVVTAGVLQAAAAVILYSTDWRYELWFASFEQGGRTMGTFVNPDHLAGYMELTMASGLGLLLSQFGGPARRQGRGWQTTLSAMLVFVLSPKMLLRLALVLVVVALVMTHSRMGNGAFFLALLLVGAIVAARSHRLRKPALWLVVSIAVVDVVVIGQWVGLDRVVQRLQDTGLTSPPAASAFDQNVAPPREESLEERLRVPKLSLQLVAQRPWLGHGGGTYVTAFPPFKVDGLPWQWDQAHNDYVQVACDTGLVGLLLWMTVGVASAWRATKLLTDRETATNRGCAVATLMALFCMGLHSMVDFNLHIPANALTFTALLAVVWAVSDNRFSSGRSPQHRAQQVRA